jgi:hypothetical protein
MASYGLLKPCLSGASEASPTGFVFFIISGTPGFVRVVIDRNAIRAKRLRKGVITGARLHEQEALSSGFCGRWVMFMIIYWEGADSSPRDISGLF